jgi:hypothetical protein
VGQPAYPTPYVPAEPPGNWTLQGPEDKPKERASIFIGYDIAMPMASLRDYLSETSFRGFEMGAFWPVWKSLHLGPVFSYHLFYEEEGTKTYPTDNGAVTANLYRYTKSWTVAAAARYFFLDPEATLRPFVGLRMGVAFVTAATLVADLSLYDTPTGFALSPEAGFLVRAAGILHLSGAIRYDYSTASSGNLDNISFLSYQFALVFQNRP